MEIIRVSLYIWYSMICTFVSHRILLMKISISFVELMPGRSCLHTNQKLVFLFFSVAEKPFFFLLFLRLSITDIAVFIFVIIHCLYLFHYNGELA